MGRKFGIWRNFHADSIDALLRIACSTANETPGTFASALYSMLSGVMTLISSAEAVPTKPANTSRRSAFDIRFI